MADYNDIKTLNISKDGNTYHINLDISGKVDKETGKGLSTNDYTTAEKNKLSGIASGAEVNQNAFSNVTVGSTTVSADSKTDTLTLVAGSNVTITPDATNDKITIAATDTTYSASTTSAAGLMSAEDKSKLNGIATGATANVGTITGIKMNGASKGTSGVVDLGTVITAHQDISGKLNTSLKGAANGLAELDSTGKVPSSQLPSYVDDVLEYASFSNFPSTGETGKIYVATDANKTYRWSGSAYVEITSSLALGETSSTAYRGDRGKTAYDHASAKGSAFSSGLYKITTNAQGHVTAATAVAKADITGLGIPAQDTTYTFDGTYNASTNKVATVSTVTNAINALDGNLNSTTPGAGKTLTAFSETNGIVSATFGNISITKSQVSDFPTSMTPTSHTHGNIQNGGTLQTNDVAIASGDKLVVTDSSDSNKVARTSLSFDGSTATKALTQKGTWESFTNNAGTITGIKMNGASKGTSGVVDLGTVITSHQTIPTGSTSTSGIVQLTDSVSSTSTTTAATPKNVKAAYDLANGKASPSSSLSLSAAAGSWTSATPQTQTITATGVTASNNIIVSIASTATSEQIDAAASAKLLCTAQASNSITMTCYGTKPTVNIPLQVVILG